MTCLLFCFRRIPFLQIGADIYCDTNMIAQVLEKLYPTPTFFPTTRNGQDNAALAFLLSSATDKLFFQHTVPQMDWSVLPKEFLMDRAELRGGSRTEEPKPLDPQIMMAASKASQQQLHQYLTMIEQQLASSPSQWFLGTSTPHYADFQIFTPIEFAAGLRKLPGSGVAKGFDESVFPRVWKWHADLLAYCASVKHKDAGIVITPEEAFKIAEAASKAGHFRSTSTDAKADTLGVPVGKAMGVNSEDNRNVGLPNVVEGQGVGAEFNQFGGSYSVRRDTTKGFEVVTHFPGIGYYYSSL